MKKQILLGTFCIFIFSICKSQNYTYYLDNNLVSTEKTKAVILGKGIKEDSLFRLDCYLMTGSKPYMSFHFADSSLSDLKGPFISYHSNGKIENQGSYFNAFEEGLWQRWDSMGNKIDSIIYREGVKMLHSVSSYHMNNLLSFYTFTDSLNDTYQNSSYDENGKISFEAFFKGAKGILKVYNKDGSIKTDSVFSRERLEAYFPGGPQGWSKYLRGNLNANVPVDNNAPNGVYNVVIRFVVKNDGSIEDIVAETNFGYGMEQEAIRVIKNGPKWLPPVMYGQKVEAYRRQPITFFKIEK
jgi:antitoxin component YwqK of YwqJK toxin-antitoxin module